LEVYAKPFEAAIAESNIGSIMNAYNEIDGIPCGISQKLLTGLLRDKLGFTGMVVSDYVTLELNCLMHRIAKDPTEAGILAIKAGLDVELPRTAGYGRGFIKAVKNGEVNEELVNRSVIRILTKKFELGLFENPYVDENPEAIAKLFLDPKVKALAKNIALKSMVLLKNEKNTLPLKKNIKSLAIIGPNANSIRNLFGDYTFVSQFEGSFADVTTLGDLDDETASIYRELLESDDKDAFSHRIYNIKSIFEAIKQKVSKNTKIYYAKGCEILEYDKKGFAEAIEIAKKAEIAILVMGGKSGMIKDCTSGEYRDRTNLTLPGVQEDLVQEVYATGTPCVLVLINGRPLSIPWEKENIPAILEAWVPGEKGAKAIADVLFGDYNPGGKLPISIPRNVGQIPIFHSSRPTGNISVASWNYVEENTEPLFPFGFGLSYTQFEYSDLKINKPQVNVNRGDEVIQLYFHDREATITRPIEELVGFKRITLEPEEIATIKFIVSIKQLGFYNENMEYVVEPGNIDVYVGSIHSNHSSKQLDLTKDLLSHRDVKLKSQFKIIGQKIKFEKDKVFFSKVSVIKSTN
jgi:beta-glucosidase